jgi:hypothetical protein
MPIGDVADLVEHGTESRLVVRATAVMETPQAALDFERLWSETVFQELPVDTDVTAPGGLWNGRSSLKKLMERRHAVAIIDGGSGPEAIGVPFPHVAIVTSSDGGGAAADVAIELEDRMRLAWEGYLDNAVGPKVQYLRGNLHDEKTMSVFFGYGIYLPDGQQPQGRVRVQLLDSQGEPTKSFDLTLSSGASAGFYREQSGIVFGGDETRTAVSSLDLPPDVLFFLGTLPRKRPSARPQLICRPLRRDNTDRWEPLANPNADEAWDGSFHVLKNSQPFATVDYIFDGRAGRLWSKLPSGPAFAIVGIASPSSVNGTVVRRWWIDLDDQDVLLPCAAMPRKSSLIVQGRRLKGYDWQQYTTRRDRGAGVSEIHPGRLFADEKRDVLAARNGHSFGYVECGGRGVFAFDPAAARGPNTRLLDWLARAMTLELEGGKTVNGLAAANTDTHVEFIGQIDSLKLRCRGRGLGRPVEQGGFQQTGELQLARGGRAAIGPLIIEFHGG